MSQLQLEKYNNFEQANVSIDEWRHLLTQCVAPSLFMTPEFMLTALQNLRYYTEKACTIVIRSQTNNQLVALFFFINTRTKWKLLKFNMAEYTIVDEVDKPYPLIHAKFEAQAWQMLFEHYIEHKKTWDILDIMELPASSPIFQQAKNIFRLPHYQVLTNHDTCGPMVDLSQTWEAFSGPHKKMRKRIRKMSKDFGEAFEFKVYNGTDIEQYLNEYIQLEQKSWKGAKNIGISKHQFSTTFYQKFLAQLGQNNAVYFGFIYISGQLVSGEIAYAYNETIYFAHGSYDPEYKKYSPGMVSTALLIKALCNKGYKQGDFLAGFANYINPWAHKLVTTERLTILKLTPRMVFVLLLVEIKKGLWRLLKKNSKDEYQL